MPGYPDAVLLLRQLRPERDEPADPLVLERILATPPQPPPRPRRVRRLALAAVALAVLAVALTPLVRSSPNVIARAAAALNDPDAILHFRAEIRGRDAGPGRVVELWQTAGARQQRTLENGIEWVEDWDTKTSLAYNPERNELMRHTEPDIFDPEQRARGIESRWPMDGLSITDDLALLFERASRGEGAVRLIGPTTVRGIDVYELEFAFTVDMLVMRGIRNMPEDPTNLPTKPVKHTRTLYVDRDSFLPVRVVERGEYGLNTITDYVLAERLPRTPANERLLRMTPHPGAKLVIEGRL